MKSRGFLMLLAILVASLLLFAACRTDDPPEVVDDSTEVAEDPAPPDDDGDDGEDDDDVDTPPAPDDTGEGFALTAEVYSAVTDSSELPDWTGSVLNLRVWNGHGTGDAVRHVSSQDVVSPEIERIFGITLDAENSFDNAGQDLSSRLAMLAATRDFPELGFNVLDQELIDGDVLYDLTDLLPIYAPTIYAFMREHSPRNLASGWLGTGRHYAIPMNVGNQADAIRQIHPYVDIERYSHISMPTDTLGGLSNIWVRDDILALAFPGTRTVAEVEALYVEQGYFTREQVFDVPVTNWDEAVAFFHRLQETIDEYDIVAANGRAVYTLSLKPGGDNWPVLAWLNNTMSGNASFNYFTYFNRITGRLELAFTQDWFIEEMRTFNSFLRDGLAPAHSLIEDDGMWRDRFNAGEYAISFAWLEPDWGLLEEMDVDWSFRKVFFDVPQNVDFILPYSGEIMGWDSVSIFRDQVAEEDLPRVLAWLDFMYTTAGQNLVAWGPATANIWEDTPEGRRFTVPELEANLVFNEPNNAHIDFNLATSRYGAHIPLSFPTMPIGIHGGGIHAPRYVYDLSAVERSPGGARGAFSSGIHDPHVTLRYTVVMSANIWSFFDAVEPIANFWDVRGTGFEPLMTRVLASANDAEFEANVQAMIDFAALHGLDDDSVAQAEEWWRENFPDCVAAYIAGP